MVLLAMLVGGGFSMIADFMCCRRLRRRDAPELAAFVSSIGVGLILTSLAQQISNAPVMRFPSGTFSVVWHIAGLRLRRRAGWRGRMTSSEPRRAGSSRVGTINVLVAYGSLLDLVSLNAMLAFSEDGVLRAGAFSNATASLAAIGADIAATAVQA